MVQVKVLCEFLPNFPPPPVFCSLFSQSLTLSPFPLHIS